MRMGLLVGALLGIAGSEAMAYEGPAYEVVGEHEGFELRRYSPYLVAEVEVTGEFDDVGTEAFWILADFIGGKNQRREEIAMTAPVTQEPVTGGAGEKIEMTAPVTQTPGGADGTYRIHFVMPATYTLETLPVPDDPRITIREVAGELMAARRYSGLWREANYRSNEKKLLEAVGRDGLVITGPSVYARYNSPFTLWFLRRNEVLVPVKEPEAR